MAIRWYLTTLNLICSIKILIYIKSVRFRLRIRDAGPANFLVWAIFPKEPLQQAKMLKGQTGSGADSEVLRALRLTLGLMWFRTFNLWIAWNTRTVAAGSGDGDPGGSWDNDICITTWHVHFAGFSFLLPIFVPFFWRQPAHCRATI